MIKFKNMKITITPEQPLDEVEIYEYWKRERIVSRVA